MSGKLIFIACLILAFSNPSTSIIIECKYDTWSYNFLGNIYDCSVENYPRIVTHESALITRMNGEHKSPRTSDDVLGFQAVNKVIRYFPRDLEKFFKNIIAIYIGSSELGEIHQSDLEHLVNLVYFYLWSNNIEVIEEGLFDYNPKLELIGLDENHIIHIDPNVFDHLNGLRYFWLKNAPCVKENVHGSKEHAQKVIRLIKKQCVSTEFLSLNEKFENLTNVSKNLNSEDLNTKLEIFENFYEHSNFSKFRPFNYKFESLKAQRIGDLVKKNAKIVSGQGNLTVECKIYYLVFMAVVVILW